MSVVGSLVNLGPTLLKHSWVVEAQAMCVDYKALSMTMQGTYKLVGALFGPLKRSKNVEEHPHYQTDSLTPSLWRNKTY